MYDDDNEIRDLLRTLADRESFDPLDAGPAIHRGHRGVRFRRLAASGAAAATVAAVALTATAVPNLGAADQPAPAATPSASASAHVDLAKTCPKLGPGAGKTPAECHVTLPKVSLPRKPAPPIPTAVAADAGADAELRLIRPDEAARRCRAQWSAMAGRDVGKVRMKGRFFVHEWFNRPTLLDAKKVAAYTTRNQIGDIEWSGFWPGSVEPALDQRGNVFQCVIPGGAVPSAADLAEDAQGSIPNDDAGLLRRCSTIFWHDFSQWKVLARQVEPGVAASVAAMSPSGKLVVRCLVAGRALREVFHRESVNRMPTLITGIQPPPASIAHYGLSTEPRPSGAHQFMLDPGVWTCGRPSVPCAGWLLVGTDRMPLNVAKLVTTLPSGRKVDIPVKDGWFAAAFARHELGEQGRFPVGRVTAYDATGKDLGSVQYRPFRR